LGLELRVGGLELRVEGLEFKIEGLELGFEGSELRVEGLKFRLRVQSWGLEMRVEDSGFRVEGQGCGVYQRGDEVISLVPCLLHHRHLPPVFGGLAPSRSLPRSLSDYVKEREKQTDSERVK